jgi:hypothetical protein
MNIVKERKPHAKIFKVLEILIGIAAVGGTILAAPIALPTLVGWWLFSCCWRRAGNKSDYNQ